MSKPKSVPAGQSYAIEEFSNPLLERCYGITHRVISYTWGFDHPYVARLGTFDECKEEYVRSREDMLRRYQFKVVA